MCDCLSSALGDDFPQAARLCQPSPHASARTRSLSMPIPAVHPRSIWQSSPARLRSASSPALAARHRQSAPRITARSRSPSPPAPAVRLGASQLIFCTESGFCVDIFEDGQSCVIGANHRSFAECTLMPDPSVLPRQSSPHTPARSRSAPPPARAAHPRPFAQSSPARSRSAPPPALAAYPRSL